MRRHFLALLSLLIAIPAGASITGVVINSDGQPIAGAKISIFAPETIEAHRLRLVSQTPARSALATQATDSKGTFNFESPKEHKVVDVTIEANGFAPDAIRLFADDDAGAIALSAAPMQRGTITADGKPVAGATVVWIGGNADALTKTDADGHYSVPDPAKWANRLIIIHPDYAIVDEARIFRTPPKLDHVLDGGVTVKGRVVGEDGQTAVANAAVAVDDFPLAVTSEGGAFTITHAPKNWQELVTRNGNLAAVRVRTNDATVSMRLTKSGKITGSVRDAKTQLPLASVEVRLGPESPFGGGRRRGFNAGAATTAIESMLTDAKGNYSIAASAGRYQLSAVYPGSSIAGAPIAVTAGQTVNKPLYATTQARVSGMVIDEDKRAVAGARIASTFMRGGGGPMMMGPAQAPQDANAYSGPDGRFVLRNVGTEADLHLSASKKGFPAGQSALLKLAPGERKSGVTITVPRGVALTGRVTDATGRPLSGVAVEPVESQGGRGFGGGVRRVVNMMMRNRDDDLVRTGTDGGFTVRVKEGTYDVVFKREGFATKTLRGQSVSASSKPVDVKLDPGVELSGRVVRSGVGVEGVNVNVIAESDSGNAVTASDGSFTITDLSPGQMILSVVKPDAFIQLIRPITVPARDVVLDLPAGGRIVGRVLDKSSHDPVTSFQAGISFTRNAGGMAIALPPMLKSFTSDDGSFTLENVPPGPTQLVVSAPGFTTARVPGLNVEDGKTLSNVEVGLETGVRLTGRVTGTDGSPISGVTVREGGNAGPLQMVMGAQATTDPNGEYTIEAVEPGEKTFTFLHQRYLRTDKSVNLSGREARLDVQLSSGMTLTGVVVTDAGVPVADASVNAMSPGPGQGARTDANGNFQIVGLAPGHYTLRASKQGLTDGTLQDFDISAGAPARIVMKSGGTITGHVTGLTDTELQNTVVSASSPNGGASAEVDSTGAYRIDGAPIGTVRVVARTNRGFGGGGKTSGVVSVQVDPGSTATADIQFKTTTIVQGRVTRNGQPMTNVMVGFNPRSGQSTSSSGTTDSNGAYQITGLDDGSYNVGVIDIDRSNAFSSTYDVHGSGTFDIDIKTASIRGRVIDATTGQPLSGAQVQLSTGPGGPLGSRAALTDPSGSFFIDNVARGSYHAVAQLDGYGHDMRDFIVGDSAPDDLEFKLAPSDGVTLNVVDARDNRPLSATVIRIVDRSGQVVQGGGAMRFGGSSDSLKLTLSPGTYTVTLVAMGYASKVMNVTSPSQITVAMTPGGTLVVRSKSSTSQRVRLIDSHGAVYRGFNVDPSPLTTTVNNIAGGTYTLQVLDSSGNVINTLPVTVVDGQEAILEI